MRHGRNFEGRMVPFAQGSSKSLRVIADVPERHRIWGERPYSVFLFNPDEVEGRVEYVNENPTKEGLPPQAREFVKKYLR
jgi:hypothetical protein